jgi:hypothetical protein
VLPSPQALELARRLAALPELAMRSSALVRFLETTDDAEAAAVLSELVVFGRRGGPPFNLALLALCAVLSGEQLGYERQAQLYAAAKEADREPLLGLFYSSRTDDGGAAGPERPSEQRELTLGHRKWLARSSRRELLDRLLRDPEPEVVPILLENPRIVERDVVALVARRPTSAEVQRAVFGARRWVARYAVKRALVLNPYTPTELGIRLLGFLTAQDLRQVRSSPALPEAVREHAERLLAIDAPRPADDAPADVD